MVYGGKPSTGCQNCRQRHIKCDETRPSCKACVRTGRKCPGYRHPLDVVLRDHTAFHRRKNNAVSKSSKDVKGDTKEPTPTPVPVPVPSASSTAIVHATRTPQPATAGSWPVRREIGVPRKLYLPLEDTVTSLFFNSYLYLPKDPHIRIGFMEILPQSYSKARFGSHVHLGALAVAFFSVAAWTGHRLLLRTAEQFFVKALSRTREALEGDVEQNLDDMLMTVLLLSTFEELSALKERRVPNKAHLRGAIALLNSLGAQKRDSPSSRVLVNAVQTQIIRSSMGLDYLMIQTPKQWPLAPPMTSNGPLQLTVATSEIVSLRLTWDELASSPRKDNADEIQDILSRAALVDSKLDAWPRFVPSYWLPLPASTIPSSVRDAGIFQGRCDCYADLWVASTWNLYRDSRIVVRKIILDCLHSLNSDSANDHQIQETILMIQSLTTDICASIPFFLGSQIRSAQMSPHGIVYPEAEERRVSPAHQQTAPLLSGWFVLPYLNSFCSPGLSLRDDQLAWIKGQIQRVERIYPFDGRLG
ncbi:Zn(II)2Cys6 transcription factor [Aspergillus thermomutatus]|uniref:Zn(2)-C6 fungal-type domain-containing protein n=1 Tax=Aspergillus thermomutatus TaxID=41047 RepID=A0A397GL51_ASPTH|nr:uncharacterized protein CDV56_105790 [Aspergillus thermomutatus]RHZ50206.1 hypothetical protein CDV56_105790 [Aspergillus thermomutatus]